jgi:uncharacterized protein YhhL (DUF1145 family)
MKHYANIVRVIHPLKYVTSIVMYVVHVITLTIHRTYCLIVMSASNESTFLPQIHTESLEFCSLLRVVLNSIFSPRVSDVLQS